MYHFYFGAPLEVLLLYPNGHGEIKVMGQYLKGGMVPQLFIPGGTFHIGRNYKEGDYSLLSTSEWISVDPEDVELGVAKKLIFQYPNCAKELMNFVLLNLSKSFWTNVSGKRSRDMFFFKIK